MSGDSLAGRNLISLLDLDRDALSRVFDVASELKADPGRFSGALSGRTLFLYFEKPSLRTRVTFEAGMTQMGGHAIYYSPSDGKIGVRESVEDVARNLERWVDGAMCRTFSHQLVADLGRIARIPVINGLTDQEHPCQGLADFFTLQEVKGPLKGKHLAYVGDGNNVAHSLMHGGARLGVDVTIVTPQGHEPQRRMIDVSLEAAAASGARIRVTNDPAGVAGADAIYTDVWASMGQEDEAEARKAVFSRYRVDRAMMDRADSEAIFMHCLPAHRGEEVTADVADSPRSVIFQQAENRLHVQKAVTLLLMGAV